MTEKTSILLKFSLFEIAYFDEFVVRREACWVVPCILFSDWKIVGLKACRTENLSGWEVDSSGTTGLEHNCLALYYLTTIGRTIVKQNESIVCFVPV